MRDELRRSNSRRAEFGGGRRRANGAAGRHRLAWHAGAAPKQASSTSTTCARYDVSIYFEANGHGTCSSRTARGRHPRAKRSAQGSGRRQAAGGRTPPREPELINQAIGDALSDMLLVEALLALYGWGIERRAARLAYRSSHACPHACPTRRSADSLWPRTSPRWDRCTRTCRRGSRSWRLRIEPSSQRRRTRRAPPPGAAAAGLDRLAARRARALLRSAIGHGRGACVRRRRQAAADELALLVTQATWRLAGGVGEMPASVV